MDGSSPNKNDEVIIDMAPVVRLYKNGRVERLPTPPIPPSLDPNTKVKSKDIKINNETGVYVRVFKPSTHPKKLPLVLYAHGGGFVMDSTFSAKYHNYLNQLASKAQVMIISVEYRLAPEHILPAAYNDCWDALKWAINTRDEPWLEEEVNFSKVYMMGGSAGANIAHHVALRVGIHGLGRRARRAFHLDGVILMHPYFSGEQRIGDDVHKKEYLSISNADDKTWALVQPKGSRGPDHPWANPEKDLCLSKLGCNRTLVCVAEEDCFRDKGLYYKETLEKSWWEGRVELVESKGVDHCFYLFKPSAVESVELMRKVVAFLSTARCKF